MNSLSGVLLLLALPEGVTFGPCAAPMDCACAFRFALIIYAAVTRNIYLSVILFFFVCVCWERRRENKTQIERRRRKKSQTMTISDSFLGLFFVSTSFSFTTCVCVILFIFFLPDFLLGNQKKKLVFKERRRRSRKK